MQINRALNLVVPVETDNGVVYIHSTPLLKETYKHYFLVLSKTFAAIFSEGLNVIAGPRIAAQMLETIARNMNIWDDYEGAIGVERGLMGEIRRLSNVIMPTDMGWKNVPLAEAAMHNYLHADDIEEAEGYIVFFILVSAISKRSMHPSMWESMAGIWGTQTTSLDCTGYRNSLQTSSAAANTGETLPIPSLETVSAATEPKPSPALY